MKAIPEVVGQPRDPDFIIAGAMKAGTTTLFRWLALHPQCRMPKVKEPEYFVRRASTNDLADYRSLFVRPPDIVSGEASVAYTDPDNAAACAHRIASTLSDPTIVLLARHPIDRLRSHYRHEVQRGREHRPLQAALAESTESPYVRRSLYNRCFGPFLDLMDDRVIVVFSDEMFDSDDVTSWHRLLTFLQLDLIARPEEAHNVTAAKSGFSHIGRFLWERNLLKAPNWTPESVRRFGRRLAFRTDPGFDDLLSTSADPIPGELAAFIWDDVGAFLASVGRPDKWKDAVEAS